VNTPITDNKFCNPSCEKMLNNVIIIIIIKAFIHLNILVTKHKIFTKIIFEMNGG
jgi:hypothetical protein